MSTNRKNRSSVRARLVPAEHDVAQGALADQAAHLEHQDGVGEEQEDARHQHGPRGSLHVHSLREIGAELHGGNGVGEAPTGAASDDEYDEGAVDDELQRHGDEKRHPLERMTEPRRREEDLSCEDRAHQ